MKHKLSFSIFVYFFILIFITLGVWQLYRLEWKLNLISEINNAISSEPIQFNSNNIKILNSNLENKNEVNSLIKKTSPDFIYNLTGPSSVYKSMLNNDDTYEKITIIFGLYQKIKKNLD